MLNNRRVRDNSNGVCAGRDSDDVGDDTDRGGARGCQALEKLGDLYSS